MAKQTVSIKPKKVYRYVDREDIRSYVERLDYGEDNPVGKKETIIKVLEATKEFDISTKNKVLCTMGNTEGYIINQNGLYNIINNNTLMGVGSFEIDKYIPVVIGYRENNNE